MSPNKTIKLQNQDNQNGFHKRFFKFLERIGRLRSETGLLANDKTGRVCEFRGLHILYIQEFR
jgi:hypothetical protein